MTIDGRARGKIRAKIAVEPRIPGGLAKPGKAMRFARGDRELVILNEALPAIGFIDGKVVSQADDVAVVLCELIEQTEREEASQPLAGNEAERAIIYCRSAAESASSAGQLNALRDHAKRSEYLIVQEFIELSHQGGSLAQSNLASILASAGVHDASVLLVASIDRLGRDARRASEIFSALSANGIRVETLDGPFAGLLITAPVR